MLKYILILLIISLISIPSYGYATTVSITTDKLQYYENETIQIIGEVSEIIGATVTIIIFSQDENSFIHYGTSIINSDKTFNHIETLGGPLMENNGIHKIQAHYGGNSTETTFEYFNEPIPEPIPLTASINKNQYEYGETLTLTGDIGTAESMITMGAGFYYNEEMILPLFVHIQPDGSFEETVELYGIAPFTGIPWGEGQYEIMILHQDEMVELEFSISPVFTLETDKSEYHQLEPIILNGTLYGITANIGDDVYINVLDEQGDEIILQETVYFTTPTSFNHTIIPDDPAWREYSGVITIQADYQSYSTTTQINYSDYPAELSLESLHLQDLEHTSTMTDYESMMYEQADFILQLQGNNTLLQEENRLMKIEQTYFHSVIDTVIPIIEGLIGFPIIIR